VIKPDGAVVQTPPTEMGPYVLGRFVERSPVAPGRTFTKRMILNEWYEFSTPGNYIVEAKLGGRVQTASGTPVAPAPPREISLQVTARDPEHLKSVCEELAGKAIGGTAEDAMAAGLALSYVNDAVAVPYLARLLKESFVGRGDALAGLVRIGNAEAVESLTSNLDTHDTELRVQVENALNEIKMRRNHWASADGAHIVLGRLRFEIQGMGSIARREVSCRQQTRKLDHVCRCASDIKPRCLRQPSLLDPRKGSIQ